MSKLPKPRLKAPNLINLYWRKIVNIANRITAIKMIFNFLIKDNPLNTIDSFFF